MPTGPRGEGILESGEQRYYVLYTNRALAEIQREIGISTIKLLRDSLEADIGMDTLSKLLAVGLEHSRRDRKDNRRPYTLGDAFDVLDQFGFLAVLPVVLNAIAAVQTWTPEKENDSPPA